jgi:hypothetical protein
MNNKDWETRDLIKNFRGFYHEMAPKTQVSTISKTSFSTFQDFEEVEVEEDTKPSQQKAKQEDKPPFAKRRCPYGSR